MKLTVMQYAKSDGSMAWCVKSDESDAPVMVCDSKEEADAYCSGGGKKSDSNMERVYRIDAAGSLRKPVKMANGWLKVDGHLTRTGVFVYRNQDGTPRRELRLPEDVFHQDSLDTFSMVPVTDDHPPKFLDSSNTGDFQRGHIGESVVRDGKLMRASMLITDKALVEKIEKGKAVEISNGYTCDLEEKPGTTDDGEKYDCIQRNIVANHVAIVSVGRAGRNARVRMDSGADVLLSISGDGASLTLPNDSPSEKKPVNKIKVDGVEYEVGSAQLSAAQAAFQIKLDSEARTRAESDKTRADAEAKRDEELKKLQAESEKNKARADAEIEETKKLQAELKLAPAKIAATMKARIALESSAKRVLGEKAARKFDALDDKELKLLCLKQTSPELKLDGKSDAYVDARFDHAIEMLEQEEEEVDEDGASAARRAVKTDDEDGESEVGDPGAEMTDKEANEPHTDSATAYEAMLKRHRDEWKKPISSAR